jgi:Protein kinase domain
MAADEPALSKTPRPGPGARGRVVQRCPNCEARADVSAYVAGQLVRCSRCNVRFEVRRTEPETRRTPAPAPNPAPALKPASPDHVWIPPEPSLVRAENRGGAAAQAKAAVQDQAAPAAPQPPFPVIDGYLLQERIGQGGMGEVFRAIRREDQRAVAVKVLGASLAVVPDYVKRFDREAAAMAQLDHPGIVRLLSRGRTGPHFWISMELVDGISLRSHAHQEKPPPRLLAEVLAQVAHALAYAHARGVVHRDLKPDNVLVSPDGRTKVLDFGLAGLNAEIVAGAECLTQSNVAMGTANYMAPEQRRDAKHVDHRADLYSFGVMAYELLTGELPVGRFPPPSDLQAGLERGWDALIERCLDVNPAQRPHSALELAHALEALAGVARPVALAPRAKRKEPRTGILSWLGVGAALSAVLAMAALRVAHDHERRDAQASISASTRAPGPALASARAPRRPGHR